MGSIKNRMGDPFSTGNKRRKLWPKSLISPNRLSFTLGLAFIPIKGMEKATTEYPCSKKEEIASRICFMGRMPFETLDGNWIDGDHYRQLFQRFLTDPSDPEALLITAVLHSDGTVDLEPWTFLPAATVTESTAGNYLVRLLDALGNLSPRSGCS